MPFQLHHYCTLAIPRGQSEAGGGRRENRVTGKVAPGVCSLCLERTKSPIKTLKYLFFFSVNNDLTKDIKHKLSDDKKKNLISSKFFCFVCEG